MDLEEFLKAIPKAELHVHLTGSVFPKTLEALAQKHHVELPEYQSIEDLYDRSEFKSILPMLKVAVSVMQDPSDFSRIVYETMREAAQNGVRYREIFWNPTDHQSVPDFQYRNAMEGIIEGLKNAEKDFGIVGRMIPSINREESAQLAVDLVTLVLEYPFEEVIGLGMDYLETGHPPEKFWKAYQIAGEGGLHLTAHAGEFGEPWNNVETSLDLLKCERIDHGYTIVDNPELIQRCIDQEVVFTVVPSNSYYSRTLRKEDWPYQHPIYQMGRLGLNIFPNSDDPPLHHTNPGQCYVDMVRKFDYSIDDIRQFIIHSINASFVDEPTKKTWRREWLAEFDELRKSLKSEQFN